MKVLLACLLVLFLIGCHSPKLSSTVLVTRLPAWVPAGDISGPVVIANTYALSKVFPDLSDDVFTLVDYNWMKAVIPWTRKYAREVGIVYVSGSFDCDKFAKAFSLAAEIAAARANIKAQPLVARIYVEQKVSWGGVPAGGNHALNAIATNRGIFVVEPQSGDIIPVSQYPNPVFKVKIGG